MRAVNAHGGTHADLGDNTILTPAAGKRLRIYYLCLNTDDNNSAVVVADVKLGDTSRYRISLPAGAIWARALAASGFCLRGAVDAPFVINLSAAQTVYVSVEYEEENA